MSYRIGMCFCFFLNFINNKSLLTHNVILFMCVSVMDGCRSVGWWWWCCCKSYISFFVHQKSFIEVILQCYSCISSHCDYLRPPALRTPVLYSFNISYSIYVSLYNFNNHSQRSLLCQLLRECKYHFNYFSAWPGLSFEFNI